MEMGPLLTKHDTGANLATSAPASFSSLLEPLNISHLIKGRKLVNWKAMEKQEICVEIIHLQDSISPPIPKCFQGKLLENWLSRVTYSPIYCLNKNPKKSKKDKVEQGISVSPASMLSPRGIANKL